MNLSEVQQYLSDHNLDGWLMADFHARNEIAIRFMGIDGMLTRRAFFFIPAKGEPTALVNPVEAAQFRSLPGEMIRYMGYAGLESELKKLLSGHKKIAMEYSAKGRLPYVGLVEAGTIELVRESGVEIVSSADMVATFQARLSPQQIESHHRAAGIVVATKDKAFARIANAITAGQTITEYDVSQFIGDQFESQGMIIGHPANCSVDKNAGDGHYEPTEDSCATIKKGSLVLIDLWARFPDENGIYADITWMAFAGTKDEIPAEYVEKFKVLTKARDAAVAFINDNLSTGQVRGCDADDACRAVIEKAGYGELFTHRTGHSIGPDVHGVGPNIDNLETEDNRVLQPGHLFSIEPGLYDDTSGLRTEINCLITDKGAEVTTLPLQSEIIALL